VLKGELPSTRRGFVPSDADDFNAKSLGILEKAEGDILYLINQGYNQGSAVEFVGNHFQLSARQRTALFRAACTKAAVLSREGRLKPLSGLENAVLHIDGFNIIITLEAAFSPETTLFRCVDGAIRDICGLHGTYRIIADTEKALHILARFLKRKAAAEAVFYLDAPVSNSGNLKSFIEAIMQNEGLNAQARVVPNPDAELAGRNNVISSDSIVIDRAETWFNISPAIIAEEMPERRIIDLSFGG
jgi:hypothetical protein